MRIMFMLTLLLSASVLYADEVLTVDGQRFSGIVVSFSLDKAVVLSTGFGNLTFKLPDAVRDVRKSDYVWPSHAVHGEPDRCEEFVKWLKDKADEKADPKNWDQVSRALEDNELDASKLVETVWDHMHGKAESVEEIRARRESLKDSWAYVALDVESVAVSIERGVEHITVTFNDDFLDVRTGKQVEAKDVRAGGRVGPVRLRQQSLRASGDLSPAEVDKRNDEAGAWLTHIDHALAEKLRAGNLVVFRYSYDVESGEERLEFVRIKARVSKRNS
jgi:hypothetical protein